MATGVFDPRFLRVCKHRACGQIVQVSARGMVPHHTLPKDELSICPFSHTNLNITPALAGTDAHVYCAITAQQMSLLAIIARMNSLQLDLRLQDKHNAPEAKK